MRALLLVAVTVGGAYAAWTIVHQDEDLRLGALQRSQPGVIAKAYDHMLKALQEEGDIDAVLARATPGQKMLFELEFTNDEIADGGLYQMVYNLEPSFVGAAERAARTIGADEYAGLLAGVRQRLPGGPLPENDKQRHEALGNFHYPNAADRALRPLDNRWHDGMFTTQLRRYIEQHPSDFFST